MIDLSIRLIFVVLVVAIQKGQQSLLRGSGCERVRGQDEKRGTRTELQAKERGKQQDEALAQLGAAFEDYLMYARVKYRVQNLPRPRLTRQV